MQKQDSLRLSYLCLILSHPSTTRSAEFTSGIPRDLGGVAKRRGLLTPQIIKATFSLFLQI